MHIRGFARASVSAARARWAEPDPDGLPKFANHAGHVAAVMAQGGFVAFSEKRLGRDGWVVCLPMIPACPVEIDTPPRRRVSARGGAR